MARRFERTTLVAILLLAPTVAFGGDWPQWRGAGGNGQVEGDLPQQWTDADVVWRIDLPGDGQSSPVIWGDRMFMTASLNKGAERLVFCVDRNTGKILWQKTAWKGEPEITHRMNRWASSTCATDGERVVAFFGNGGLHAFEAGGKNLWSVKLAPFQNKWGTASSPLIVGDVVLQNCESEGESFLLGVDKQTGEQRWKTVRAKLRGWSSPLLVRGGSRQLVAINDERGVNAYDPASGKNLWFCKVDRGRGTPTVTQSKNLLIAVSGRAGDMVGMDIDGNEVWRTKRKGGRDLGSPIVIGEYLCVVSYRPGIATCYRAATGELLATTRLSGNFSASPITAGGLLYVPSEAGEVFVLRPGPKMSVVARNRLKVDAEEVFRASLAGADGQVFLRSDRRLYRIGKK